jgi:transglutaminase-like putative cysteine protease
MKRHVESHLSLQLEDRTSFVLAMAIADGMPHESEQLSVRLEGRELVHRELPDLHGTRLHVFDADPGILQVDYAATVIGRAETLPVDPADAIRYLRPSRYVQSDSLTDFARATFGRMAPDELVPTVAAWVAGELRYDIDSSPPTGGAVETLEVRAGVCRDYAHLVAALLRALDVPARLVSVYAPGLWPMDFHAVVEALVGDRWLAVDATRLAPRRHMVRIATGRDAADVAFETNTLADITLLRLEVGATADDFAPEDPDEVVELG